MKMRNLSYLSQPVINLSMTGISHASRGVDGNKKTCHASPYAVSINALSTNKGGGVMTGFFYIIFLLFSFYISMLYSKKNLSFFFVTGYDR